jgi:hypothetical protein
VVTIDEVAVGACGVTRLSTGPCKLPLVSDEQFYAPGHKISQRQRTPGEPLFSFRTADHRKVDCELRFLGEALGWQAAFYIDREFSREPS